MSSIKKKYRFGHHIGPEEVYGQMAIRTNIYHETLLNILKGRFEVQAEDYIDKDYVLETLLIEGRFALVDTEVGILPLRCGLAGFNWFNQPTGVIIKVPKLNRIDATIGEDCVLYHTPRIGERSFFSYLPLIDLYAEKLAATDSAIEVNLINTKTPFLAEADTKAEAESIKKAYDEISTGLPLVVYKSNIGMGDKAGLNMLYNNVHNVFIANDLQDTKRSIFNEFLTIIGINNTPTEKKERLVTDEVNSNNVELEANLAHLTALLDEANKQASKMFGTNFKITERKFNDDTCTVSGTMVDTGKETGEQLS